MKMGDERQINRLEPVGEIYTCPICGYTDGFHVSFKVQANNKDAEVLLICPSCHSRFGLGWQVSLEPR